MVSACVVRFIAVQQAPTIKPCHALHVVGKRFARELVVLLGRERRFRETVGGCRGVARERDTREIGMGREALVGW